MRGPKQCYIQIMKQHQSQRPIRPVITSAILKSRRTVLGIIDQFKNNIRSNQVVHWIKFMTSVGYDRHTLCANRRQKRTNQGQLEMKYSVDQNIRHLTWTLKRCFGLFRMSWGVFTKSVALPKWIKNRFGFCSVQSKKLSRAILEMSN